MYCTTSGDKLRLGWNDGGWRRTVRKFRVFTTVGPGEIAIYIDFFSVRIYERRQKCLTVLNHTSCFHILVSQNLAFWCRKLKN